MFRDLKEYQDITKIYQSKVYTEDYSKEITEAFESEEFTEEEVAYIEENFDSLLEEVIEEEEETLSEQVTGRQKGKMLRQKANEILSDIKKSPVAKNTPVSSKVIQGKPAGVVGKFKSALSKVGSKIGNVAKTAVKTGAAPFKSGGAVSNIGKQASKVGGKVGTSGIVRKGAKLLSKMGPAGKLAAVAGLTGAALLANRKKIKAAADKAKVKKEVEKKPEIKKIDPKQFDSRRETKPEPPKATETKPKKMHSIEKKNRARFGDEKVDKLKAKQKDFKLMRSKKMSKDDFIKKYPKSITAQKAAGLRDHTEWDAYDMVLEYLYSTEQVSSLEEANYVMTEMDAETIQGIVEMQGQINRADIIGGTLAAKNAASGKGKYTAGKGVTKDFKLDPAFKLPKV